MRRHRGSVFRLLRSNVGDADAAVDLTQQSFIAAFSALHSYDGERPFRLWISRIAINKARDWARRRAVRRFFTFRSEEHTSELQSLMRISYAVFCLKQKIKEKPYYPQATITRS